MQSIFKGKHFISLQDWSRDEIDTLLEVSLDLKKNFVNEVPTPYLFFRTFFLFSFNHSPKPRT